MQRVVLAVRAGRVEYLIPSFASAPGIRLAGVDMLTSKFFAGDVVGEQGGMTTRMAFDLEQRAGFDGHAEWSTDVALVALAHDAAFFADEDEFSASPISQLGPDADADAAPPEEFVERGWRWPPRMAPTSFVPTGMFAEPDQVEPLGRINGKVLTVEARTNSLTGQEFLVCRTECLGFQFDLLTETVVPAPSAGAIVGTTSAFLVVSNETMGFDVRRRGWPWATARKNEPADP